jgi:hypothetical protein
MSVRAMTACGVRVRVVEEVGSPAPHGTETRTAGPPTHTRYEAARHWDGQRWLAPPLWSPARVIDTGPSGAQTDVDAPVPPRGRPLGRLRLSAGRSHDLAAILLGGGRTGGGEAAGTGEDGNSFPGSNHSSRWLPWVVGLGVASCRATDSRLVRVVRRHTASSHRERP